MKELEPILERARGLGLVGPQPVARHLEHALAFAAAGPADRALDLGSGAGVPGLILAFLWPSSLWMLLDAGLRRVEFLRWAVSELAVGDRCAIHHGRAEEAGRDPALRGAFELVTARGFGSPAVTAECGAPFLAAGGRLVVSEPPEPTDRWPSEAVAELGLGVGPRLEQVAGRVQVLVRERLCPDRFPRRDGIPAKRPLF